MAMVITTNDGRAVSESSGEGGSIDNCDYGKEDGVGQASEGGDAGHHDFDFVVVYSDETAFEKMIYR